MASEFNLPAKDIKARLTMDEKLDRIGTDTGLTARQANTLTNARIQLAISELIEGNLTNVNVWLREVGSRSPERAIELMIEITKFRMPQMQAAKVIVNASMGADPGAGGRGLAEMTIEELQSVVAEG